MVRANFKKRDAVQLTLSTCAQRKMAQKKAAFYPLSPGSTYFADCSLQQFKIDSKTNLLIFSIISPFRSSGENSGVGKP